LQSVAIIIPSKNRLNYCLAQIKYYNKANFRGTLVIVDSSSKSSFLELQKNTQKINLINVKLFHKPLLSTHQAISFGLKQIKDTCNYFVVSGDDDFFVVDGIDKAERFLDSHPDFIGVVGKGIIAKHIRLENEIRIGWVRTYWKPRNISDMNNLKRVRAISKDYLNLEFAVKRVSVCIDDLSLMNQVFGTVKFNNSTDLEICSTLSVALAGRVKYLRTRFLIRGDHDARPNSLKKPNEIYPTGKRKDNFVLYLSSVLNKYDESIKSYGENIINDYFVVTNKKKQKREEGFMRYYFFYVRVLRKFSGLYLRYYYKKYFELFTR
jgi:glycosyltransferase domain-containing protein